MWECCQSQFQLPIGLRGIATICPSKRFPPLRALGTDRRGCRSLSEPYRGLLSVAPGRGVAATGGIWNKNHLNPIGVPCALPRPHATAPHMEPLWGSCSCFFHAPLVALSGNRGLPTCNPSGVGWCFGKAARTRQASELPIGNWQHWELASFAHWQHFDECCQCGSVASPNSNCQ